ncbi:hypothetical protein GGR90_003419 [Sphingopyxis italica]|uniref:Guanylate cyclase domain-containing protein n=1 Tax=Sphingopyxis italica TaxID=1129133 RepID=A0A7X6BAT8_9SPHN|nr:hypothetical protein [Sphingopyxis italica]NJB91217.1 hypothetical protein [Sphingopyxis italica]
MPLNYYFLSFIDILGFSEMVRSDCHSGNSGPTYLPIIQEALSEARKIELSESQKLVQFSDSIIVSRPYNPDIGAFKEFIESISLLQCLLFRKGILCRGGVAHGKHSEDSDIIFSQALVEAYRIENSIAQFPRVVISDDLLNLFSPAGLPLATDTDGLTFVNYLLSINENEISELLSNALEATKSGGARVAAKGRWLVDYCRSVFPDIDSEAPKTMAFHH